MAQKTSTHTAVEMCTPGAGCTLKGPETRPDLLYTFREIRNDYIDIS